MPRAPAPAPTHGPRERGILFSAPMVAALLAGTKTQTRRALPGPVSADDPMISRRFGVPGERLWVRERFVAFGQWRQRVNPRSGRDEWFFSDLTRASGFCWRFDGADPAARRDAQAAPTWHARPALFMPRAASRILLEVLAVRVEPLQAINADDAIAEGIVRAGDGFELGAGARTGTISADPVLAYRAVWERINGAGSWDSNPWVAAVSFMRLDVQAAASIVSSPPVG